MIARVVSIISLGMLALGSIRRVCYGAFGHLTDGALSGQ
jgi:hypothetical protein